MNDLLKAWVDHGVEARRLLKLCTRDNWSAGHNYREHMAKEAAIIRAINKSCQYWHEKELRQKELDEQRQESASDTRAEVGARPSEEGSPQGA